MNDFERLLSDALKKTSDGYRPSDPYAAKERFLQRLRRRQLFFYSGAVALAGTAAAVAGFLVFARDATPERAEPLPPAARLEEAVSDIEVGERPSGVAYGDDSVWVANSGDGTVMVIDPVGREVVATIDVGGDPDDVAVGVGAAWVSDSGAGTVTAVSLPSAEVQNEPVTIEVGEPGSIHMDVAPGADGLWIAKDDSLFRVDPMSLQPAAIPSVGSPTDVAVGEGSVYVLGTDQIARVDPATLTSSVIADIPPSRNQDLAFRDGYLWIANGDDGDVTRLDPATGDFSAPIYVGGNFSGISVDEDAVWVVSGGASEVGVLTRIDPDTLAVLEPRAELLGRPYDITTGAGLVWIANQSAGTVSGLHPDALPGGPDEGSEDMRDPVFAFSGDDDIWAESFAGRLTQLTDSLPYERNPTVSPDATQVAYEVVSDAGGGVGIEVLDLATGEKTGLLSGTDPAFGPDGRLAWIDWRGAGRDRIAVARPGEEPIYFEPIAGVMRNIEARDITWDLDGEYLYYTAGTVGDESLYQADADGDQEPFELIPGNHRRGATYLTPSVRSPNSVHVIRICCLPTPSDFEAELGIIRFTEGGPQYESIAPVDVGRASPTDIDELASAGNLALDHNGEGDHRWRHTVVRSWFVSTDRDIWLVDAEGTMTNVTVALERDLPRGTTFAGLATFPDYDD